ncbi:Spx/MgsR family RNA polymerase-binding regulatory protein [Lactococcus protaetiae]|uniref:Spx/MgsR family RNA polymerase-binding regulatory protein n=1 Tax=Lactococcus protaetiae TaxID=2592653 RepID=A0A514Z859_9LACT|nr:Spx/MgsR family RNA polymerase-binding regulatory protein [Lactococcus protaetiae]QDK70753.1 Spx/MgsR family RNA polymerase-binding regulatory protein [Lactococcus protaetiae]
MLKFGERLKKLRIEKGLSQTALGRAVDKGHSTVSIWEMGSSKPKMEVIIRLAKILGTTTDYLLGVEEEQRDILILYTRKSCSSSLMAKRWLENRGILFKEVDLVKQPLTKTGFIQMLQSSDRGTTQLIAQRSRAYQKLKRSINFDELTISELSALVQEYPTLLKSPILYDRKRLEVGFNEVEIRAFVPRPQRQAKLKAIQISIP